MINFSLILPTRKKPRHLQLMIESIFYTTKDMSKIEIVIGVDTDDNSGEAVFNILKKLYPIKAKSIFIHSRQRGSHIEEHYMNWLASLCTGKYIIMTNDDCLFRTIDWDIAVFNKLEEYLKDKPDGLVCGIVDDKEKDRAELGFLQNDFSMLTQNSIEALGFFLEPRYNNSSADTNIAYTYHLLDRVLDLRKVCTIEHNPPEMENLDNNYVSHDDRASILVESKIKRESFLKYDTYSIEQLKKLREYMKRKK